MNSKPSPESQRAFARSHRVSAEVLPHYEIHDHQRIQTGFDLTLLGLGLNGHLGMNEPGSPEDRPTGRVELHETTVEASAKYFSHRDLPRWGLTVGLRGILGSKEVWLLANGRPKAAIVERTVAGEIGPHNPASLLRRHPNCWLFVDADAAALLGGSARRE